MPSAEFFLAQAGLEVNRRNRSSRRQKSVFSVHKRSLPHITRSRKNFTKDSKKIGTKTSEDLLPETRPMEECSNSGESGGDTMLSPKNQCRHQKRELSDDGVPVDDLLEDIGVGNDADFRDQRDWALGDLQRFQYAYFGPEMDFNDAEKVYFTMDDAPQDDVAGNNLHMLGISTSK